MERGKRKETPEEAPGSKKAALDLKIDLSSSVPSKIPNRIRRAIRSLRDYVRRKDREPLVGLEYILEYRLQERPDQIIVKYFCEVCDLNCELVPMIEHLGGSRHRRFYLAKDFPYVMRAPPHISEDKNQFLRRMALEIEQEIGLKDFKVDPMLRTVSIMNVKTVEARLSKRNSRWEKEIDRPIRMKKAMEYLESIEITSEEDEARARKLAETLMSTVKSYHKKVTAETLFPVKVAKAHGVAKSIMMKATQDRRPKPVPPPLPAFSVPPPLPMPVPGIQVPPAMFYPGPPVIMAATPPAPPVAPPPPASSDTNNEDLRFFRKLKTLLAVIPENEAPAEGSTIHSKLLMLKTLFEKKGLNLPSEDSLKQKLLGLFAPQNSADPNVTAPEGASVPPTDQAQANQAKLLQLLLQSRHKVGAMEAESLLPGNQNIPEPGYPAPVAPVNPNAFSTSPIEPLSRSHLAHAVPSDLHRKRWDRADPRPDLLTSDEPDRSPYIGTGLAPNIAGHGRFLERGPGLRRPFDDPEWSEREMGGRYEKRARREGDFVRREDLPIRGKDVFGLYQ